LQQKNYFIFIYLDQIISNFVVFYFYKKDLNKPFGDEKKNLFQNKIYNLKQFIFCGENNDFLKDANSATNLFLKGSNSTQLRYDKIIYLNEKLDNINYVFSLLLQIILNSSDIDNFFKEFENSITLNENDLLIFSKFILEIMDKK